jgi:hypothetical protein
MSQAGFAPEALTFALASTGEAYEMVIGTLSLHASSAYE